MLSRIFQSLAGVVPSMPALWREKVKVLCSKRCGLMPLNTPPLHPPPSRPRPPLLFSPSGQTVFMLLDEWKKERGNFYLLRRFSPRQNSKLNSICLDLKKQQMGKKKKKITSDIFVFIFVCFLPLKLEPNVPLRGWEEGACPTDTDGIACREENKGMYTVGVRVCVCVCVCACVRVLAC